jgi:acyl carrier protein
MSEIGTARRLLAEAVHAELAAVPEDARIGSFERWDSLAHLRLVLALEAEVGRELDAEGVVRIECLNDVRALLEANARS